MQQFSPTQLLKEKVKTMLSPSERLLYNVSYFFGIKLGVDFAQEINARLTALAFNRSNTLIDMNDFKEATSEAQQELNKLNNKLKN